VIPSSNDGEWSDDDAGCSGTLRAGVFRPEASHSEPKPMYLGRLNTEIGTGRAADVPAAAFA
jgi:hypothetical protein